MDELKKILEKLKDNPHCALPGLPAPPAFLVFDKDLLLPEADWSGLWDSVAAGDGSWPAKSLIVNSTGWKAIVPMPPLSLAQWQELSQAWETRQADAMAQAFLKAHELAEEAGWPAGACWQNACTTGAPWEPLAVETLVQALDDFTAKYAPGEMTLSCIDDLVTTKYDPPYLAPGPMLYPLAASALIDPPPEEGPCTEAHRREQLIWMGYCPKGHRGYWPQEGPCKQCFEANLTKALR